MGNAATGDQFPAVARSEKLVAGMSRMEKAVAHLSDAVRAQSQETMRLRAERDQLAAEAQTLRDKLAAVTADQDRLKAQYRELEERQREARSRIDATIGRLRDMLDPVTGNGTLGVLPDTATDREA